MQRSPIGAATFKGLLPFTKTSLVGARTRSCLNGLGRRYELGLVPKATFATGGGDKPRHAEVLVLVQCNMAHGKLVGRIHNRICLSKYCDTGVLVASSLYINTF